MHHRQFIGAVRAMHEYGLNKEDLKDLTPDFRRSPYHGEPPTLQYREEDVRRKAIKVHGSIRALEKYKIRTKSEHDTRALPVSHRPPPQADMPDSFVDSRRKEKQSSSAGSWRVVRWAIGANLTDMCCKGAGWLLTGSHSMFAEMVHSGADTLNQVLLGFGVKRSARKPDKTHPYGYANVRHVTSLIAGVAIFFCGTGLNFYHGISALMDLQPLMDLHLAFWCLGVSVITQGTTLWKGYKEVHKRTIQSQLPFWTFLKSGADPSLNVVVLEDSAAVLGVFIAFGCMALSTILQNPIPDAVGSLLIGGLLGGVSWYIVNSNTSHLLTRSVPEQEKEDMVCLLETDPVIKSVHDVKATEMGLDSVRLKAELDFDGRRIAEIYLADRDIAQMLSDIKKLETEAQLKAYLMHFGDKVVDKLGEEVDRIEQNLKKRFPDLRHIDLEGL